MVQSKSEKINHEGLQDILVAKENDSEFTFYVGPRLGTISPWSSKTEDIIRNVGFDNIERVVKVLGMVNCSPDFKKHPYVINGFSELMADVFGSDNGIGVRSAVGMMLPGGIPVEIEAMFELK